MSGARVSVLPFHVFLLQRVADEQKRAACSLRQHADQLRAAADWSRGECRKAALSCEESLSRTAAKIEDMIATSRACREALDGDDIEAMIAMRDRLLRRRDGR